MLFAMSLLAGTGVGMLIGADFCRPFGFVIAIIGGLLGASGGLGLALLHAWLVSRILGPLKEDTSSRIKSPICEYVYATGMMLGLYASWFGTFLTAAFVFRSREPRQGELSPDQCRFLFSIVALGGYTLVWSTQRLIDWIESKRNVGIGVEG